MSTGPASRSDSLPRFGRGAAVGLFLLFLLLGVAFTAPLVRHLRHALPYAAVPTPGRELVYGVFCWTSWARASTTRPKRS